MKREFKRTSLLLTLVLVLGCILPPAVHAAAELPSAQAVDLFATATNSVRNDTPYIQGLIDAAVAADQREVTIPRTNPADGSSLYQIGTAIELPSNITVMVDNCTLRLNDGALCNIFISKGCYASSMSAREELENIKIIGRGNAVLDGGTHNGVTEKTATRPNGFSTVRYNTSIHFRNVNGFEVKNLTIKEPRYWGMTFIYSRNGTISNIRFDCSNEAPNQDGIDLRLGCNNIVIENISGVTGDDTVALTALSSSASSDIWFSVAGKDSNIHDVTIRNVKAFCKGGYALVRLLAHHGNQVYNVRMENLEDTSTTTHPNAVLRLGDTNYASTGTAMAYGDIHDVSIDGLISNGLFAIYAGNHNVTKEHVTYKNVTTKYGNVTNLSSTRRDFTPLTQLDGDPIFLFNGADATGWEDNISRDVVTNQGTLEGKSRPASVWPLVATGEALQVITPEFQTNTDDYDHIRVSLVALNNGYDPSLEKLTLHYSMNNGGSWVSVPLTIAEHGPLWKTSSGSSSYYVSSFTSDALCPGLNVRAPITNMMIKPYGNSPMPAPGAFRLLSMEVRGSDHVLTHHPAISPTTTTAGVTEHWSCSLCENNFSDKDATQRLSDTVIPPVSSGGGGSSVNPVSPAAPAFTDIEGHWAQAYLTTAKERGLVAGYPDGRCGPDDLVTRAQFVTILWKNAGWPKPQKQSDFVDLEAGEYYLDAVAWAQEKGYVAGKGEGRFAPNDPVSREEIAVILRKLPGGKAGTEPSFAGRYDSQFTDSDKVSSWGKAAVYWAVYNRVWCDKAAPSIGSNLRATEHASRAEVAVMMIHYQDNVEG